MRSRLAFVASSFSFACAEDAPLASPDVSTDAEAIDKGTTEMDAGTGLDEDGCLFVDGFLADDQGAYGLRATFTAE